MPNWCHTTYYFEGKQDDISKFYQQLKDWTSKEGMENGFGNNWLGNILYHAGLEHCINSENPEERIRCRGTLCSIDAAYPNSDDHFTLDTETAWCAMPTMFQKVIEHFNYDIQFAYQAEEPNMQYYEIYDPHGFGCFDGENVYIDMYLQDIGVASRLYPYLTDLYDYRYWSKNDFEEWLKENNISSIEQLEDLELPFEDDYISVHYFQYRNELEKEVFPSFEKIVAPRKNIEITANKNDIENLLFT